MDDALLKELAGSWLVSLTYGDWWSLRTESGYWVSGHSLRVSWPNFDRLGNELLSFSEAEQVVDAVDVPKGAALIALLRWPIERAEVGRDGTLVLAIRDARVELGVHAPIVDWQWCIDKIRTTPIHGYAMACFGVNDVRVLDEGSERQRD